MSFFKGVVICALAATELFSVGAGLHAQVLKGSPPPAPPTNPAPPPAPGAPANKAQPSEQPFAAELLKAPVRGKTIVSTKNLHASQSNAATIMALQNQRQLAETALMAHSAVPLSSQRGISGGASQTMSAGGMGQTTSPTGQTQRAGTLNAAQPSPTGRSSVNSTITHASAQQTDILPCLQDSTFRILSVSGSLAATFTPIDQYNLYVIKGCSFGAQAPTNAPNPTDSVHVYGNIGSFYGRFAIKFWSDNEIDVSLDPNLGGFLDMSNVNLVIKRADGQQTEKGGFKFYAARATVMLASIPQSWATIAALPSSSSFPNERWAMEYSAPPASSPQNYPKPAIAPPGPASGSAYISRSSDGHKAAFLDGVTDYYDFSHLAPGWTTDSFEVDPYDQACPWTVTYRESFGAWSGNWDGNNIRIGLSTTSCSGFNPTSMVFGVPAINYQNWSGSYYALKVWVTGPRGTDPLTGKAGQ